MRLRANLVLTLLGILTAGAIPAAASTINFEITYTTQSGEGCSISCFSIPANLLPPPYTKDFSLTSAQLAADGSYDIFSFLGPTLILTQPGETFTLTALAIVAGGVVTDATIAFTENYPVPLLNSTALVAITASDGTFRDFREVSVVSTDLLGVYTIAELPASPTPEPATFAVAAVGLALLVVRRRSHASAERS